MKEGWSATISNLRIAKENIVGNDKPRKWYIDVSRITRSIIRCSCEWIIHAVIARKEHPYIIRSV